MSFRGDTLRVLYPGRLDTSALCAHIERDPLYGLVAFRCDCCEGVTPERTDRPVGLFARGGVWADSGIYEILAPAFPNDSLPLVGETLDQISANAMLFKLTVADR